MASPSRDEPITVSTQREIVRSLVRVDAIRWRLEPHPDVARLVEGKFHTQLAYFNKHRGIEGLKACLDKVCAECNVTSAELVDVKVKEDGTLEETNWPLCDLIDFAVDALKEGRSKLNVLQCVTESPDCPGEFVITLKWKARFGKRRAACG